MRVSRHQGHDKRVHPPRLGFQSGFDGFWKNASGIRPHCCQHGAAVEQQDPIKLPSPRAVVARASNCLPEQRSR